MVGGCREDGVLARELRLPEVIHGPRDVLFAVPPFRPVEDEVRRDEQIPRPDVRRDPGKGARRSGIHLPCEVPLLLASVHVVHRLGVDDRRRLRLADEDHALLHVFLREFDEVDAGMPRLRSCVGGNDLERFAGKGRDLPAEETATAEDEQGLHALCFRVRRGDRDGLFAAESLHEVPHPFDGRTTLAREPLEPSSDCVRSHGIILFLSTK